MNKILSLRKGSTTIPIGASGHNVVSKELKMPDQASHKSPSPVAAGYRRYLITIVSAG